MAPLEVQQLPNVRRIFWIVAAAHVVGLALLTISAAAPLPPVRERVVVRTITLNEGKQGKSQQQGVPLPVEVKELPVITESPAMPEPVAVVEEKPVEAPPKPKEETKKKPDKTPAVKKEVTKPVNKAAPKKETKTKKDSSKDKKKSSKKTTVTPKKETKTQTAPAKKNKANKSVQNETTRDAAVNDKQQAVKKVRESLAKIDKSQHNFTASEVTGLPKKVGQLQVDSISIVGAAAFSDQERSYIDELHTILKRQLGSLPEYGEVKIKLTLARTGEVLKSVIVQAKSQGNRAHVEKKLPSLHLPGFGDHFSKENQYTFEIHLIKD